MQQIMSSDIVKLQDRGIITIPLQLRKALSLEKNSLIRIRRDRSRLVLEPVRTLPYPVRSYSDDNLRDFFSLDAEETKTLKKKDLL